tara:strand:+ start:196 stop:705 length:510 start_codon:yes stop_codon:yes gene_type:complete
MAKNNKLSLYCNIMNENVVQIGVALVIVNLVAWGGFTMLQDDDTKEYIDKIIYQQPDVEIANVTVTINYNGLESNATVNTNMTNVTYDVTVIGDTSAMNATLEAHKDNFVLKYSWYSTMGAFVTEIDGVASGDCSYWQLLHNGNSSMIGASSLLLVENDSITWEYTEYC